MRGNEGLWRGCEGAVRGCEGHTVPAGQCGAEEMKDAPVSPVRSIRAAGPCPARSCGSARGCADRIHPQRGNVDNCC